MEPSVYWAFAYGAIGSVAVELLLITQSIGPKGGMPAKFRTRFFWGSRVVLAFVAGMIATSCFSPQVSNIFYVQIGAATPALLTRMSQNSGDDV